MVLSPAELLSLSQSQPVVREPAELLALGYDTAPQSSGLVADEFRANAQEHGESFRYWHAHTAPGQNRSRKRFIEADVWDAKGFFYSSSRDVEMAPFGLIPAGSTQFSCLPSDCEVSRDGYLLRSAPAQYVTGTATFTRGSSDADPLPERFVREILKVTVDGEVWPLSQVRAIAAESPDDDDLGGIKWLEEAPAPGSSVWVRFRYSRLYTCLGEAVQGEPAGADGERLPQRVLLQSVRE